MMKFSVHAAIMAIVLLGASAGVLIPIYSGVSDLEKDVGALESVQATGDQVMTEFVAAQGRKTELDEVIAGRQYQLVPENDHEAQHQFETRLRELAGSAGLTVVSTRRAKQATGGVFRHLTWDLVVEGDADMLDRFLVSVEGLEWITRVLRLSIEPGENVRRINLDIAVMLEQEDG